MTPEELNRQAETLDLINREIAARLDRQSDSIAKIDTKAGLVIGYAIAAASFLATRHAEPILTGLAFASYAIAAGVGIAALAVWNYQDIEPEPLVSYAGVSHASALAPLISRRVRVFGINAARQRRKAVQWWISLAALVLGAALMVAAILVQTYQHGGTSQRAHPGAVHLSATSRRAATPRPSRPC
jgi:uncharacterized membrane protein (UPF0136 family)